VANTANATNARRIACVASVSVGFGSKELLREKWSPIFRADKTPKIPFLGLSLLPNPTETLATQATRRMMGRTVEYTTAFLYSDWLYFLWHGINGVIFTRALSNEFKPIRIDPAMDPV